MSNGLNLDQDQHSVRPGLGPNYLQKLSADDNFFFFHILPFLCHADFSSCQHRSNVNILQGSMMKATKTDIKRTGLVSKIFEHKNSFNVCFGC